MNHVISLGLIRSIRLLDQRAGVVIDLCSLSDRLGGLLAYAKRLTRIHATALPYNKGIWYSQGSSQFPSFGYTDDWSTTGYNQFGELDCKSESVNCQLLSLGRRLFQDKLRILRSIIGCWGQSSEIRTRRTGLNRILEFAWTWIQFRKRFSALDQSHIATPGRQR
jgi:hypothetical protein